MARSDIISAETALMPYFKELVDRSVYRHDLDVTDESKFYVVNLLNSFSKTERLFERTEDRYEETPLAILLTRAIQGDRATSIKSFKKLGDIALYVAGYFSDHVDSKQVDLEYYVSMGEGAFSNLSGMLVNEKVFAELYEELSVRFTDFMGVLADVRVSGGKASNSQLLRLYERWLKTGDPYIKERLEKEGINPEKIDIVGKNH